MTREERLQKRAAAKALFGEACVDVFTLAADPDEAGDAESEEMKAAKATKLADARKRMAKAKLEYESAARECAAFGDAGDGDDMGGGKGADDGTDANKPPPPKDKPAATSRTAAGRRGATARPSAVTGVSRIEQLAREITGGATEAEVLGRLQALGASAEEEPDHVATLERIEQLEGAVFASRSTAMLKDATDAGKLTPKLKAYAAKIADLEQLGAFLEALPVVAATRTNGRAASPDTKNVSQLSADTLEDWEVQMCERIGTSREDYLAQKKANAERRTRSEAARPIAAVRKTA